MAMPGRPHAGTLQNSTVAAIIIEAPFGNTEKFVCRHGQLRLAICGYPYSIPKKVNNELCVERD